MVGRAETEGGDAEGNAPELIVAIVRVFFLSSFGAGGNGYLAEERRRHGGASRQEA